MKKLLMGNEAVAYAALAAGVRMVAGYPGTPSSEVVETVAKLRGQGLAQDVHVEWSTNEKAALEVLAGASLSGARCLFTCKQMGLNVASDALLPLNYIGTRGGLVLYVADDPGPISSQTEQDTRRFAAFAKVPVLDPATPEQLYAMVVEAFDLSESLGAPVIVRPTTRICHASTFFQVEEGYQARAIPEGGFKKDDSRWVIFPARSYRAHQEIEQRLASLAGEEESASALALDCNPIDEVGEQPKLGIVAGGVSTAYLREALQLLALQGAVLPAYRLMQVGMPYPFPEAQALGFAQGLESVLVFEELDYVLEDAMLKLAGRHHLPCAVHGKLDGSTPMRGENTVELALACLKTFFDLDGEGAAIASDGDGYDAGGPNPAAAPDPEERPLPPARPPVLCAGCPHRGSFYAVKQALRKYRGANRAVLCGDIGCYTLGNAKPLDAVDTCLCMGAGITMAQGIAAAEPGRKVVAFVGDSTFFASGLTGVANAVYNNHDITICVLDNSTTAMTGSQPHPGTGITLMDTQSQPIGIEGVLRALGVKHVEHANAFDLGQAKTAAKHAIDFEGPSAVIFEGPCIQLTKPAPSVTVDPQACTGCSGCVRAIGCPAMSMGERETLADSSTTRSILRIDSSLCNGCNLCIAVCPFGAIRHSAVLPNDAQAEVAASAPSDLGGPAIGGDGKC